MSAKAIREATGKDIINRQLQGDHGAAKCRFATVTETTQWQQLVQDNPWLETSPLVVKPDQLIKRRGKLGLIAVNKNLAQVKTWVNERMGKDQKIGNATGKLRNFIIEPFVPHKDNEEAYVCIYSHRTADTILFYHQGGVDIGDVDAKALKLEVPVGTDVTMAEIEKVLLTEISSAKKKRDLLYLRRKYRPPTVPMDYSWARELGLIRKPASFMTSICDERGQELLYAGMPISDVLQKNVGIGGVVSLLWFQRCLPPYVCKFFEMCLMVTADHGPAVSGAHNTIVCARAGKDLVSSVVSGLLTIGDRFGGALDGAAKQFSEAYDSNLHPMEFVNSMRKKGQLIMGIGHRVKSINNPDVRVKIIKEFVMQNFPAYPLLEYALEVEKITTSKKPNLILNVDGVIATSFVDMLRNCGSFTSEEAQEYINIGAINSLFVLGRSIGFIGHYMDQKRLKQGLYRHPWDDISYVLPEQYN
uniref:ATP-citrate synthase ATP-grasp domain-containing protein n=1 Tax=Anopheles gambiae TaxID=7165 RepID=A0A1S4H348_ANOGA